MSRVEILEKLLNQLSVSCSMLAAFAAQQSEGSEDERAQHTLWAVQTMAEGMGAVASLASPDQQETFKHLVHGSDLAKALATRKGGAA